MKRLFLFAAMFLCCSLAYSQEAEDGTSAAELTIIPKLEFNPYVGTDGSGLGYSNSFSALYTLFEGSFSEHVSFTLVNQWLQLPEQWGDKEYDWLWPYHDLGSPQATNWLNLLYFDFNFGNWTFTLGKQDIALGGFEFAEWDWDLNYDLTSPLWNTLPTYQWGLKAAYTLPSENSTVSAQIVTSPLSEHYFTGGAYTYSLMWEGEYGPYSTRCSANAYGKGQGEFDWGISLGQRYTADTWSFTLDYHNIADVLAYDMLHGHSFRGEFVYNANEKLDLGLTGLMTTSQYEVLNGWVIGAKADYYPLADSRDLRTYAALSYNHSNDYLGLILGIVYNLRIKVF